MLKLLRLQQLFFSSRKAIANLFIVHLFFIILFTTSLLSNKAFSEELLGKEIGSLPFAMGRAYTAIADDWLALHYNPAGLALVNGVDLQFIETTLGANRDTYRLYEDFESLSKSGGSLAQKLNKVVGRHIHLKLQNVSQMTAPHFAIGFLYDVTADLDIQNATNPVTKVRFTRDVGFIAGFGVGLGPQVRGTKNRRLRLGLASKFITRRGKLETIRLSNLGSRSSTLVDDYQNKGLGLGVDLGMQYQWPINSRVELTSSFAWYDIGHTSYGGRGEADRPTRTDENMVVGLGVRIPIGGKINRRKARRRGGHPRSSYHLSFAVDYSHLNYNTSKEPFAKHMHAGMNLDLPIFSLQAGVNQSGLTGGLTFDIGLIRTQLSSYSEELGSYAGQYRDRRYLLSLGFGFGVGKFSK